MRTAPRAAPTRTVLAGLVSALVLAGCGASARADESSPEDRARDLAAEVLRKAGDAEDGLGEWTRSIVERARERAAEGASGAVAAPGGRTGGPAPLPAERHAGGFAEARPSTAEIIVFMSLGVPAESWRQWAREAARIGAPLVLRGVAEGSLPATVKAVGARIGKAPVGIAVDPRLFRLFGIERVPAVAVVPGGAPPCASRGCSDDAAPPHDLVAGNIGLVAALEAVASEGGPGSGTAKRRLAELRGEPQ